MVHTRVPYHSGHNIFLFSSLFTATAHTRATCDIIMASRPPSIANSSCSALQVNVNSQHPDVLKNCFKPKEEGIVGRPWCPKNSGTCAQRLCSLLHLHMLHPQTLSAHMDAAIHPHRCCCTISMNHYHRPLSHGIERATAGYLGVSMLTLPHACKRDA